MTKPDIVVIGTYPDRDLASLAQHFTLHIDTAPDPAAIRAIAFKGHAGMSAQVMDAHPNLRLIANYGVGYDAIDVAAAVARGIAITNTPDVLTDDVADLAVGMLIAVARHIVPADAWVRTGAWAAQGDYPLLHKVSGARDQRNARLDPFH